MFFALDDDQREFDAAVRTFLAERFDLDAVRACLLYTSDAADE